MALVVDNKARPDPALLRKPSQALRVQPYPGAEHGLRDGPAPQTGDPESLADHDGAHDAEEHFPEDTLPERSANDPAVVVYRYGRLQREKGNERQENAPRRRAA